MKKRVREQDSKWATLSKKLTGLRLEFTEAKEAGNDFTEDTETKFKDQATQMGTLGTKSVLLKSKSRTWPEPKSCLKMKMKKMIK